MRLAKHLSSAVLAAGLALAACPPAVWAATPTPFSQPAFQAAQQQGKPILVEITASWCPVCAKQRPILSQLLNDPRFRDMVVYNIDFDSQKDLVREMGAHMQSTLIVFNGGTEKAAPPGYPIRRPSRVCWRRPPARPAQPKATDGCAPPSDPL